MPGEKKETYDPLISGLEPEPFDTVFQELFSGVRNYFFVEEPKPELEAPPKTETTTEIVSKPDRTKKPEAVGKFQPDENSPQPSSATTNVSDSLPTEEPEQVPKSRTRQYPMLRCGSCLDTFVSEFSLEHHEATMHSELFGWFCSECNIHFDTLRDASDHSIVTHAKGELPVYDRTYFNIRKQGIALFMQAITRRSSEFVKDFLRSRERHTIMTTSYFTFSKSELQAVFADNIGLVLYHQAKTDLLTVHNAFEHEDLVSSLKRCFIYGDCIKRVPLVSYTPPATVYKTLTFNNISPLKKKKTRPARPGTTLRDVVAKLPQRPPPSPQSYILKPKYRVLPIPYSQTRFRTVCQVQAAQRYRSQVGMRSGQHSVHQVNTPFYYAPIEIQH